VVVRDRRPTILVIEDEASVRQVTRRALERDASVLEAADGEEGLALRDQLQPAIDLVVTDFMMPSIDGLRVIAVLARYRPDLPIVGMTGHTDPVLRESAARYGVRVLQKPFDIGVLVASVREVLSASPGTRAVQGRKQADAATPRPPEGGLVAAAKALVPPSQASCA
jgi:CheY-like chemotaxis protein